MAGKPGGLVHPVNTGTSSAGRLVVLVNGQPLGEYRLQGERIMIGRHPDCEIRLDDLGVSGKHAMITLVGGDALLEDLGSTNGTFVNGATISKYALKDGDVVTLGQHTLRFRAAEPAVSDREFEKTMVIRSGTASATPPRPAGQGNGVPRRESYGKLGRLTVLTGRAQGQTMDLTKSMVTLGRPGSQVAVITRRSRGYFINHVTVVGSARHPLVNGVAIGPTAHHLMSGDVIELAGVKMEFTEVPLPGRD